MKSLVKVIKACYATNTRPVCKPWKADAISLELDNGARRNAELDDEDDPMGQGMVAQHWRRFIPITVLIPRYLRMRTCTITVQSKRFE